MKFENNWFVELNSILVIAETRVKHITQLSMLSYFIGRTTEEKAAIEL